MCHYWYCLITLNSCEHKEASISNLETLSSEQQTIVMSSKDFATSFFPVCTSFVSSSELAPSFVVDTWNRIFPDENNCGLPSVHQSYTIIPNRPCLAITAILGAYIGLKLTKFNTTKTRQDSNNCRGELFHEIYYTWLQATKYFGYMNIVALLHHCIFPPPTSYDNNLRKHMDNSLWALDCFFTCVSSAQLIILTCLIYNLYTLKDNDKTLNSVIYTIRKIRFWVVELLSITIAILSIILQYYIVGSDDISFSMIVKNSVTIELCYLFPLQIAAMLLLPLFIARLCNVYKAHDNESTIGILVTLLGGVVIGASLPLDSTLCSWISTHAAFIKESTLFYDIIHMPTILFLGCNISFVGFSMWINSITQQHQQKDKSK